MNNNIINLIAAVVLSLSIIFGWQYFFVKPEQKKQQQRIAMHKSENLNKQKLKALAEPASDIAVQEASQVQRIKIESESLTGSIALKGLRFDDLILKKYKQDLSQNSPAVRLFSPANTENAYFAEIGLVSNLNSVKLPNSNTVWNSDSEVLSPEKPVNLFWINEDGIKFLVTITVDKNYLFTIEQTIINNSDKELPVQSYGLINRKYISLEKAVNILHQGPIGCIDENLKEYSYDDIKDKKSTKFALSKVDWIGITDKYWLSSLIPDKSSRYSSNFNYALKQGTERYQVDFISPVQVIKPGENLSIKSRIFAGAKKVDLLDEYEKSYDIKLFDRAIDFGWFYIITKPVFYAMNFFYGYVGNFGISILIVTVIIKLLMFTLANKSYRSMKKMKNLQPEIDRIKNLYNNDKARLNQEIMALYKKEKVNPVAGCLPILVQIPVFFSIYKVLYVTIEMRQAPFFGWIKDLSSPDPTTIFNLFGLLPFAPPSFLMIGAWPILMAITMFLHQKMSPELADPIQAQVMKFMPLIFLFMFSSFPVGLLIYWSWNNILSIIQQYYINKFN
ncbi:membrane protein insertase YidC [Rickettsia prowazekii]|uniref:Membrane protein insertase YidC n=2 Tax=Rickettsia prowazekii TaxID=782 RepID=YIDC_RICPR|nr:membrane protein insertase YidC [Rickettsia prowazekii]Q9ZE97.1 RecName: Full=Membrane protein insertase YidC; AltName: Full=Foldase YidC; AltName: Full=Membrane integrase YidC; AltName: Full=Membrane protein YidC [Rickettsia prowazekii str. Madrid E]EOB10131.1 Membrane protein insertase YidC [Rickettsia prowazekii str. GvF12]ADE29560.1 Preprotein translocase subunit YidC [Rickettsia prowazekii str. Rp22]AFE48878.1 membrane protein insertase [Rickettsia prowazekii str. Chernikova]AFE49723.1